jgi:hypothetical protein
MSQPINSEILYNISTYGTYYNPAEKHYDNGQTVICDRCYREKLDVCIGYEKYDLCLDCVKEVVQIGKPMSLQRPLGALPVKTRMIVNQFTSPSAQQPTIDISEPDISGRASGAFFSSMSDFQYPIARMCPSSFDPLPSTTSTTSTTTSISTTRKRTQEDFNRLPMSFMEQGQFDR